jgi:hypothetical protein
MFVVTETDAEAIRATYEQDGELSAAIELRRRFPGITDNARAGPAVRPVHRWVDAAGRACGYGDGAGYGEAPPLTGGCLKPVRSSA